MAATPSLPPYAHFDAEAVQCIAQASERYGVPELLLHSILLKENGRNGQCSKNKNGSFDCGLAQINTQWADTFAKQGVGYAAIAQSSCLNIQASAYILKSAYLHKAQDWFKATVAYNIGENNWSPVRYAIGYNYAVDVVKRWQQLHDFVTLQLRGQ